MVVTAVCVFGWVSFNRLDLALMPNISYPTLTIRTEYDGAAPEEIEALISQPLESQLGVLRSLVGMTSVSQAGKSDIILEFEWGADMNLLSQEIREKVDRVRLPDEASSPLLLRFDPSLDPMLRVGFSGEIDLYELREWAEEELKPRLESVPGVAAVRLEGGFEEEIHVELRERTISRLGLDITEITNRLARENINIPGGRLEEGQAAYLVRTLNEFDDLDELGDLVVSRQGGANIRLRDIAEITRNHRDRTVITRVNGRESVEIEFYKESDANLVTAAARVRDRLFGTDEQRQWVEENVLDRTAGPEGLRPAADQPEGGNPWQVQRAYRERVSEYMRMTDYVAYSLPEESNLTILSDQSVFIEQAIDEVKGNAVLGGLMAIVVLFAFLRNLVHTLIVGVTIPVSIVATFAPMYLFDVSMNIMSLGGLALGVGMLVDNSIVVLESIFRRREEGDDSTTASVRGVGEVAGAVIASTLTTAAVFFPIVFVEGIAGQVFGDMSLTVVFSLFASLVVALFFVPMLASRRFSRAIVAVRANAGNPVKLLLANLRAACRFTRPDPVRPAFDRYHAALRHSSALVTFSLIALWIPAAGYILLRFLLQGLLAILRIVVQVVVVTAGSVVLVLGGILGKVAGLILSPFLAAVQWGYTRLEAGYPAVIRWSLANRVAVVVAAGLLFAFSVGKVLPGIGRELIPTVYQGEFNLHITLPVGTPIDATESVVSRIERDLEQDPRIERITSTVGTDPSDTSSREKGEHTAILTIRLPAESGPQVEQAVIAGVRQRLRDLPGAATDISHPVLFSFKTPIEIELRGKDLDQLRALSDRAVDLLDDLPSITDVQSTLRTGFPELQVSYNRDRLAEMGLDLRNVAEVVLTKVQGRVATDLRRGERDIDVLVRLREDDRLGVAELERLVINPDGAVPVPLGAVADIRVGEGPSEIRRLDQQRAAIITANLQDSSLGEAVVDIESALRDLELPEGFETAITGQSEEMGRSLQSLLFALLLAIFLVYVVMASQFESLIHPFVIIFTVPLALIGVIAVLALTGSSLSVIVFIGVIMLCGIVVNNAIVLVDTINRLRRSGRARDEAIVEAGRLRLRPILITTLTTVLALLPMALGLGEGSEIRAPMALTVVAGLLSATVLTLVVIPTVYSLAEPEKLPLGAELPDDSGNDDGAPSPSGGRPATATTATDV